jgi:hypothetical protein
MLVRIEHTSGRSALQRLLLDDLGIETQVAIAGPTSIA